MFVGRDNNDLDAWRRLGGGGALESCATDAIISSEDVLLKLVSRESMLSIFFLLSVPPQGCLPLVLMFDIKEDVDVEPQCITALMEQLDVFISIKPKPKQPSKVRQQAAWKLSEGISEAQGGSAERRKTTCQQPSGRLDFCAQAEDSLDQDGVTEFLQNVPATVTFVCFSPRFLQR